MKPTNIFMTGDWRDLIMTTFEIDKDILDPYLPKGTEIDLYNNKALLSMVGFTFSKVKFYDFKVPFHQDFGQINFRFYVKSKIDSTKGVVFIKEFAPKPLITLVANLVYNEPYFNKNITNNKSITDNNISLEYNHNGAKTSAQANLTTFEAQKNTLELFVVDRYVAFIKNKKSETLQYKIFHKPWQLYNLDTSYFDNELLNLLPITFKNIKHVSTCFVDGSSVEVKKGLLQQAKNVVVNSI
ncbi:DUF2071 domain-containing protein [Mariniflexile sp. HNIBRBA6329]|uniref:DUF2071 domain-containing protein n=1 Tax=Mariniflexile sp. HNIBRBA6329 TaxID=3373088 RepID=UPI0037450480